MHSTEVLSRPVLQKSLPMAPWAHPATARLPGIQPLDPKEWIICDDAYSGQMAQRDVLISEKRDSVHRLNETARPAALELLDLVLADLKARHDFRVTEAEVTRPDGVRILIDRGIPLLTLGRLVQNDFCLMERDGTGHWRLTGAILCFPASWSLIEKFGRELGGIHDPVDVYDDDLARRVARLFDAMHPDRPLWRANALAYADPALHQPRQEDDPRTPPTGVAQRFLRSERQTLRKLPRSGAVAFGIHTYVVSVDDLTDDQRGGLSALSA